MNHTASMLSKLTALAATTDYLITDELADVLSRASPTIYKSHSSTGHYFGIRPVKLGNRLLWPIEEVIKMFTAMGLAQHQD